MVSRVLFTFLIVALLIASPVALEAQNLVINPNFDTDLTGWSGLGSWDSLNFVGAPSSGSATWLNDWAGAGGAVYLTQCIELVVPIESFEL